MVIAYAKGITKDEVIRDIPTYVEFTITQFHKNGSLNYSGKLDREVRNNEDNRTAQIYFYEGDQWGNYEAVGYFEENKTINIVVLNCKSKDLFLSSIEPFLELVESYFFITDKIEIKNSPNKSLQPDSSKADAAE